MSARTSLLDGLAGLIERTYDFRSGLGDLGPFLVGDRGYRRLRRRGEIAREVAAAGDGARVLVREDGGRWALALYYPDRLIGHLERHDPRRGLGAHNVDGFATFVEELDHLLLIADRARPGAPPLTLLELEWHAEVTKYLAASHFLARTLSRSRLGEGERLWLRYHLFEKGEFCEPDPEVNARYREARRLAVRLLGRLGPLSGAQRLRRLRRFHRQSHGQKLAQAA